MSPEHRHDAAIQGAASIPSLGAIATWVLGVPVEKWAALAGIGFILVQIAYLGWKWRRDIRREDERLRRGEPPPETTDKAAL
ncbi:MAG TPA: hypothetical protein PL196_00045 [Burkholderiaceae bacterium]|nr:hypothetical protein [Burkholderiaceae bacterium]